MELFQQQVRVPKKMHHCVCILTALALALRGLLVFTVQQPVHAPGVLLIRHFLHAEPSVRQPPACLVVSSGPLILGVTFSKSSKEHCSRE